jgi:alanyl-tRNA synthetase
MLGAFAFGDSRKPDQIQNAWNLALHVYKLAPSRLWVTYFGGDTINGHRFEADLETRELWRNAGVQPDNLLGLDGEMNFWKQNPASAEPGQESKCGPTSEIFFDSGAELSCGPDCRPGCSCGRFVEFLNMLFISWSWNNSTGSVNRLADPFIEIVIGVERLAMVLQGMSSIFEIDSLRPLLRTVYQAPKVCELDKEEFTTYSRIVVDHVRALVFLVADGAPAPDKGGRAFIMRRLIRETIMSMELLGIDEPAFLPKLVDEIAGLYREQRKRFEETKPVLLGYIRDEKEKFEQTLSKGFQRVVDLLGKQDVQWISGKDVLRFEKDFGLPLPMLARFLVHQKIAFSSKAYEAARKLWELDAGD